MNEIKGRRGGNIRNKRTKHPQKDVRRKAAQARQEAYNKLSLDEKIKEQLKYNKHEPFKKQYVKLLAQKASQVDSE